MTSFLRHCPVNLTFLALQCPIFNQRSTHANQISQIKPNWNKKSAVRSKGFLENFSLKLLCDVIFSSFPFQSDIPSFKMSNFQWDDCSWKEKLSAPIKFICKPLTKSKVLQLLYDFTSPLLLGQSDVPCFTMATFH